MEKASYEPEVVKYDSELGYALHMLYRQKWRMLRYHMRRSNLTAFIANKRRKMSKSMHATLAFVRRHLQKTSNAVNPFVNNTMVVLEIFMGAAMSMARNLASFAYGQSECSEIIILRGMFLSGVKRKLFKIINNKKLRAGGESKEREVPPAYRRRALLPSARKNIFSAAGFADGRAKCSSDRQKRKCIRNHLPYAKAARRLS